MYVHTSCACLVSLSRAEGSDCPFLEGGEREGGGVVLILIRYKIELGQKKALFSQSESHLVVRAYRPKFPSFLMEFLE